MRDAELHDVFERLADRVDPSPALLDDIRVAVGRAERGRRIRVAAVIVGLLVLMTAAVLVLAYVRSNTSTPDAVRRPNGTIVHIWTSSISNRTTEGTTP